MFTGKFIDQSFWYKARDGKFYPDMETVKAVNDFWFEVNFPKKFNKYEPLYVW